MLAAVSFMVALSACSQVVPVAEGVAQLPRKAVNGTVEFFDFLFSAPELSVEAIEIGRLQQCNTSGRESALQLFSDPAALHAWETERGVQLTSSSGELPPGTYAIAELGERATGGYALAVSRKAAVKDDVLYLKGTYLHPSVSGAATQTLTSPCSLITLPTRTYRSASLLDQANKVRATWSAAAP